MRPGAAHDQPRCGTGVPGLLRRGSHGHLHRLAQGAPRLQAFRVPCTALAVAPHPPFLPAAWLTWPCAQNLVVMTVREARPGGVHVIASQSVADALGPPPPRGSVRARLVSAGGVVLPSPTGGCDVMFMTQARGSQSALCPSPERTCASSCADALSSRALLHIRWTSGATCRPTWLRWWRARARWRWRLRRRSSAATRCPNPSSPRSERYHTTHSHVCIRQRTASRVVLQARKTQMTPRQRVQRASASAPAPVSPPPRRRHRARCWRGARAGARPPAARIAARAVVGHTRRCDGGSAAHADDAQRPQPAC